MNRVLSIEQSRSCTGQSEYVTKRLCISVVFTIAFLCVLGGYFLGRITAERNFSQSRTLFKTLSEEAEALVKKAGQLAKDGFKINSSEIETMMMENFKCEPLTVGNFHLDLNNFVDYVKSILLYKENKLLKSIEIAMNSIDVIH